MKEDKRNWLSRRGFLQTITGGLIATSLVGVAELSHCSRIQEKKEEEAGKLADEADVNFNKRGFTCAESVFRAVITQYGESEKLVRLATPFSGGIGQGDLCGFLSGGVLALGMLFGRTTGEDHSRKEKCITMASEYYNWWKGNFPLHCSDIRKFGGKELCTKVGRKASSYLEEIIEKELKA